MKNIYLLHGFLGLPQDWDFIQGHCDEHKLHFINIYEQSSPKDGIECFSKEFNRSVDPNTQNILVGYSLGGRLGLHALLDQPDLWYSAAFVSTHPGLATEGERAIRIVNDGVWAMRFLTMNWPELMGKWNEQAVFTYSKHLDRKEIDFDREVLADVFTNWGLGQQENLKDRLAQLDLPIQWVIGKNDSKFSKISQMIDLKHSKSQVIAVEEAGHRVPWDNPARFIELIKSIY